jgi:hypothetical protein
MSKSYRKPYAAITGVRSAHEDKTFASRSLRRTQNYALRAFKGDWDEFIIPVRLECAGNDVGGWGRDGVQSPVKPPHPTLAFSDSQFDRWWFEYRTRWYEKCQRK